MTTVDPRTLLAESFSELDSRVLSDVLSYVFVGRDVKFPSRLREKHRLAIAAIRPQTRASFYLHLDSIDRADDQVIVRLGRLLVATKPSWYPWPAWHPCCRGRASRRWASMPRVS